MITCESCGSDKINLIHIRHNLYVGTCDMCGHPMGKWILTDRIAK